MRWPQIIIIALYTMSLGIHLAKHGEEKTGKYNFWSSLLSAIIIFALLKAGGFFS